MPDSIDVTGSGNFIASGVNNSTINASIVIGKSGEYRELEDNLNTLQKLFDRTPKTEIQERLETSEKINKQKAILESFKRDVLTLAETFERTELNTERLQKAKEHFDKGEITEARVLLEDAEEERSDNVTRALIKQKESEEILQNAAAEYLILAQATALDFENPRRFEDTRRYYEQSIAAFAFVDNLFNYAYFLWSHNQFQLAAQYYRRILEGFSGELSVEAHVRILVNFAISQEQRNEFDDAEENYQKALKIRRKQAGEYPETYLPDVALTLNNLAILHRIREEFEAAESEYSEALEIRRKLAEKNPEAFLPKVATTLNNLANLHRIREEFEAAENEYGEALEILQKLARKDPETYLPNVAMTINNLAVLHRIQNEFEAAEGEYGEALKIYRKLVEKNPEAHLPNIATTLNNLANLHYFRNEFETAEGEYGETLEIYRKLAEKNPETYNIFLGGILMNIAIFYQSAKPEKEMSIAFALEAIVILLPFVEKVPTAQNHFEGTIAVLKEWGMNEKEIMAAFSEDE